MMELFPYRLNLNDKPFGNSTLIVAGGQAEIFVPTVAAESMAGARRRDRIKTSRRDFRPQALDNVVRLPHMGAASSAFALASGFLGLLVSYHLDLPSGPAIVLVAGLAYLASVVLGPRDSVRALYMRRAHLEA